MPTGEAQAVQYGSPSSSGEPSSGARQSSSPGSSGAPHWWHAKVDMRAMVTAASDGCGVMEAMDDAVARAREIAEGALGHPVPHALPSEEGAPIVAASVAGDPPCARVAWVAPDGEVVARVSCPPGRPSIWRPVVAAAVSLEAPPHADRVLVGRLAPEAVAAQPLLATDRARAGRPGGRRAPGARAHPGRGRGSGR